MPQTTNPGEGPDDLDLGFDQLIQRFATHRVLDAEALARLRPDLARILAPPEVTFAAYLADGTIVLCCPDGLPASLMPVAEILSPLEPPASAKPGDLSPALAQKLTELEQQIRRLQPLSDPGANLGPQVLAMMRDMRADLHQWRAAYAAAAAPVSGPELEQALSSMLAQTQGLLQATENRLHAAQNQNPAFAQTLFRMEESLRELARQADQQPSLQEGFARLYQQIDALPLRPASTVDLAAQRQGAAQFMDAMATVLRRLDLAVDRLEDAHITTSNTDVTDLATHLTVFLQQMDDMPKLSDRVASVLKKLDGLTETVSQHMDGERLVDAGLATLTKQIEALALRPDPVLDLAAQRQSFAQFQTAMGEVLRRLDAAAMTFETRRDLRPLVAGTEALGQTMAEYRTMAESQSAQLAALTDRIADLGKQPSFARELAAQRQSFAQFATVLSQTLRRVEQRGHEQENLLQDLQVLAAQAILALLADATWHEAADATDSWPTAQHPGATGLLRAALAEAVAVACRTKQSATLAAV